MVTDAMLQNAAVEAEQVLASAVADAQSHEFSKGFEKKMGKLIRRQKHPVRYQILRYVAIIVLVMAVLFGTVMAVSPQVRASLLGWFKESFFGPYAHYSNVDSIVDTDAEAKAETEYDYYLTVVPEEFEEWQTIPEFDGKVYMYTNDAGDILRFTYTFATGNGGMFLDVEGYAQETVYIGTTEADLYYTVEGETDGVIVWISEHGGVIFNVSGPVGREELIAMAESVQHRKLTEETTP